MLLDIVSEKTTKFLARIPKSKRKQKGQFFTSKNTAKFMADMFNLNVTLSSLSILDPGAGTGILSAALIDRIISEGFTKEITLTCYENDEEVLPILKENLKFIKDNVPINFNYELREEDYIISQSDDFEGTALANTIQKKYDFIIANPPYLRIMKNNVAAQAMPSVIHGAPNLYFLFTAMSLFNLKQDCELVCIIPRSWTSGEYFKAFRNYLFNNGILEQVHLFVSRNKVFNDERVLQETIIIKVKKSNIKPDVIKITTSESSNDFENITGISVPYDTVVVGAKKYVYLPTSLEDVNVIKTVNKYNDTFLDIGLKMKTGIVVDFRQKNELRSTFEDNTVPLFYSQHIKEGRVNHNPSGKDFDWIVDSIPGLIQKNKNYLFCKRFTAKEEKRRLQCGVYLASDFPNYKYIGTQNKINFIDFVNGNELSISQVYGIYALLNSTLFDRYYRIMNGSTQVNSSEINSIPVPPIKLIEKLGDYLLEANDCSTTTCDNILRKFAYYE